MGKEEGKKVEAAKQKEACIKDKLSRLNPFDGLVHNKDGSKEFLDGGKVETVNGADLSSLSQAEPKKPKEKSKKEEQDDEDKAAEAEGTNAEADEMKKEGKKIE